MAADAAEGRGVTSPATVRWSRRRTLTVFAAAAGYAALGVPPAARLAQAAGNGDLYRWRGQALGARASLLVHHPDAEEARRIVGRALAEVDRLEAVFSLYRDDSALVRLNRAGRLDNPPLELVDLLARARQWSRLTGGAFDVTVQPLWDLHRRHFARAGADPNGPDEQSLGAARALVDYRALEVETGRVAFARPGMAATANGIAQGYICDRIADLLRDEGLDNVLIDLGEIQALGLGPGGAPWRVGLADPRQAGTTWQTLDLTGRAVATSALRPEDALPFVHIFDPTQGRPAERLLSASVVARRAADADALSTALLASARPPRPRAAWSALGIEAVFSLDPLGAVTRHSLPGA
jgi:thiamine biosynthesis lipoprotein